MSELYDLIIIGGGPAGLSAGVYGGRAKLKTLLLEKGPLGGRAFTTREIVNYPGYNNSTGPELTKAMADHAQDFGVEVKKEEVKSVDFTGDIKTVYTKKNEYQAKAVIIATGTEARVLGIPGERELAGQGVAYCATCDAEFFQDQEVVVVGSGDQAIEEGMFIAKFASKITVIVLHDEGILDCNKQAAEKAFAHPKMNFIWNSVLDSIVGEDEVTGVKVKNMKTGEITDLECQGVFFFVGMVPGTNCVKGQVELDQRGWLNTNDRMETSVEGVYAVGDVRNKYLRQVSTAIGDGAIAATAAERYIEEQKDFQESIVESEKPVLMGFWTPEYGDSLEKMGKVDEANRENGDKYKFVEVDITRKKGWAKKFGIEVSAEKTARVIELQAGKLVRELDLAADLRGQM
ncbi:MAG: thioredoxin-disulfide reductase [Peptococcaceae bacterium]|nr:thioredoxin-disulfide reductase [Peptococcaceae bacterium]